MSTFRSSTHASIGYFLLSSRSRRRVESALFRRGPGDYLEARDERKGKVMSTSTLIIVIVVLVILFGGGGYYWRRGR
jgi:hypothetical protein